MHDLKERNHEDSDINEDEQEDDVPTLMQRNYEDSDSSDDEDEDDKTPVRAPIDRKNKMLFKDSVTNNPIDMQKKFKTMNVNDAHHKWGHQREKRIRAMGN